VKNPDQMTERLRKMADHWCAIAQLTDEALAEQVHQDGIDILVDLSGHTAGNRLQMFARKPAPVQVTWLGYPNTTGMPVIDYRLTDDIADPPGRADQYSIESLVRLPNGFLCYEPPEVAPDVAGLPVREAGRITFGSFNILPKMNASVIALWSQILNQVSGSCLLLKCRQLVDEPTRRVYLDLFARHKISADRIKMLRQTPSTHEHLALYNKVDIALDPFPYNGTTTTCEALWMGVPVVTLEGGRHSARVGASILTRVGLAELITGSQAVYVTKAVALACDLERLTQLRSQLRRRMQTSPLCDAKIFARQVEEKYQDMWYAWCRRKM
jgi:predicted O-linked N-acetylglucosamine transferase (SPINDLY family)